MNHPDSAKKKMADAKENLKNTAKEAQASAKEVLDEVESTAKATLHTTRVAAQNAMDKAQAGLKSIEQELSPTIDDLAARAQTICNEGIHLCARGSDRIRRQFQQTAENTTRYVIEQPGKSILMAAAVGAAVAAAFLLNRRR